MGSIAAGKNSLPMFNEEKFGHDQLVVAVPRKSTDLNREFAELRSCSLRRVNYSIYFISKKHIPIILRYSD